LSIEQIMAPVQTELDEFETIFSKLLHSEVNLAEQVVQYISTKRGKRVRPMLVFLAAKLHGESNAKTMSASLVVEMLHTATLIHDDVVDDSSLRRGIPTINEVWNNKISVLVGDYLFSKTLTTLLDIRDYDALEIFSLAAKLITEGELLQITHSENFELSEQSYFDLISKKTAALFKASCELGTLTTIGNGKAKELMGEFGQNLGIAFQIKDDLLDYVGTESNLGKPTGNDIRENKVTLPLIFALKKCPPQQRKEMLNVLENGMDEEKKIEKIINFVQDVGGVAYSTQKATEYCERASKILEQYKDSPIKNQLQDLVDFTIYREN
jgi:octaprenyl-diphosphate synthase